MRLPTTGTLDAMVSPVYVQADTPNLNSVLI